MYRIFQKGELVKWNKLSWDFMKEFIREVDPEGIMLVLDSNSATDQVTVLFETGRIDNFYCVDLESLGE